MSIVRRNHNQALMSAGAAALVHYVGEVAFSSTGKKMIWDGMKYIAAKLWNKKKGKVRNRDYVAHPGALPGAIAAPVAVTRIIRASKPKFVRSKGSVTITHREMVGQINTSSSLVVNEGIDGNPYRINPSNSVLFPWLQTLASNFDQYTFERLSLQYVPLCGTTTTGRVAMYFDKDSQDAAPGSRIELANMAHLTETSPWAEASLNIPVDRTKRFNNDSATTDTKLIDLGQIGFGTYGSTGVSASGDLFIHYTVTFYEPQPSSGMVSTTRLVGTDTNSVGPAVFTTFNTDTSLLVGFNSPGTYLVVIQLAATSITGDGIGTGVTENSHDNSFSAGILYTIWNITVDQISTGIAITGTGFGNYNVSAVRARSENSVLFP